MKAIENLPRKRELQKKPELPMREFTFHILTNPPMYEIALGIAQVERKTVKVMGYTRKDAMRRAGIL